MQTTEPVTETFGHLTVVTWKDAEGISINVFTAGRRNSALSATYLHDDREAAIAWYRTIRDAAVAGTPVWLIEAQVSALIDAAQAVGADAELAASINATMDAAQPTAVDVSDIVDGMPAGGGWNAYRQQTTTRAAVTSDAMDRVLDGAVDGFIPRSKQATSKQLIALKARGLVELQYGRRGNQRVIVGARITGKGAKHAAVAA